MEKRIDVFRPITGIHARRPDPKPKAGASEQHGFVQATLRFSNSFATNNLQN